MPNLNDDGVQLYHGAVSPAHVAGLRNAARYVYDWCRSLCEDGTDNERELRRTYHEWRGLQLDRVVKFLARRMVPLSHPIAATVSEINTLFAGRTWSPELSFFRVATFAHEASTARWHCDNEAASSGNRLTVWLPLDPVGEDDGPSLEIVLASHQIARPELTTADDHHRGEPWVATLPGERWIPTMSPGDALVLDPNTLHRTQRLAAEGPARLSCELRFL